MTDQVYLIPGGGLYEDTEQGKELLVPGTGIYQEREAESGSTLLPISGNLPAMAGSLTMKKSYHRSLGGTL